MNLPRVARAGEMVRTFIALPLPEPAVPDLVVIQNRLLAVAGLAGVGVRLTPVHQFHVTLAFLGEISQHRVASVVATVADLVQVLEGPLRLVTTGLVAFPSARRPRVIGAAFVDPSGELTRAVTTLHERLRSQTFAIERREFRPHVTLARLKQPIQIDCSAAYTPIQDQVCSKLAVYQSRLAAEGARYEVLYQTTL